MRLFSLQLVLAVATFVRGQDDPCGSGDCSTCPGYTDGYSIQIGEKTRTYGMFLPEDYTYDPLNPRSIIFDFHGRSGTSCQQYNNSRYWANTDGKQYIVVYPQGCPGSGICHGKRSKGEPAWQGACYADPTCNDLLFVDELLNDLFTKYSIDLKHVYASGKSNGGGFVDTLACSHVGDRFAAFGMAAAALYTDNPDPNCWDKRRPIMEAHGTMDDVVNINGNKTANGGPVPNIMHWTDWWGKRDGCLPDDRAVTPYPDLKYELTTFTCAGNVDGQPNAQTVVSQYTIEGMGHCWPTITENYDSTHVACQVENYLDYTDEVVKFFEKWSLATTPSPPPEKKHGHHSKLEL